MSEVTVDIGMSLEGFVAGPNAGTHNPLGDGGTLIHRWRIDAGRVALERARVIASPNVTHLGYAVAKQR
jgi:hypothetical protein